MEEYWNSACLHMPLRDSKWHAKGEGCGSDTETTNCLSPLYAAWKLRVVWEGRVPCTWQFPKHEVRPSPFVYCPEPPCSMQRERPRLIPGSTPFGGNCRAQGALPSCIA